MAGNTFAQLVSKFEILDAMSSASTRRDSHVPPRATPAPSAVASSVIIGRSPFKPSALKTRDRSSTDSSLISPGCFIPPRRTSPRPRRAQTFETKAPVTPATVESTRPRQKSVAERRKMFEAQGDAPAPSTPVRTYTSARSTSKLAHSKSWKSIKTSLSAPESHLESTTPPPPSNAADKIQRHPPSHDQDSASTLLPASSADEYSSHHFLAPEEPFGTWTTPIIHPDERWMALKRESFAVTAFDTSPSYVKSQYIEPELDFAHTPLKTNGNLNPGHNRGGPENGRSKDETRQHGWVQNAQKMAHSLSSSALVGQTKSGSSQSRESPRISADAINAFRSFQFTRTGAFRRSNLPRSRISSLRKKFDLPKSDTVSSLPALATKRQETDSGKTEDSHWPSKLSLPKSATNPNLGTTASLASRSKSFAPRWREKYVRRPQTPPPRRKTEHNVSPLKQKIDLFESFDREKPAANPAKLNPTKKRSVFGSPRTNTSGSGPFKGLRKTLRRISTSCRKSTSEWSTTSSRPGSGSQHSIQDIPGDSVKHRAIADSELDSLSPGTIESIPERPVLGQTRLENEISPLDLGRRFSVQRTSVPLTAYNIDGEPGLSPTVAAPAPLFSESQSSRFFRTKIPLIRSSDRFSLPDFGNHSEEADVHCRLEQPKPIRANELRRLVGICKQKVQKLSAGGSE
ncbi:hypothetical protein B0J15DRAFT_394509 [Fusarium solani]|uniref:Uncharacterized protein n=1 Tax=Fusarium solani TaxID=169388 RepID=A0A9P9HLY8_FUSSL|nr:uncharacterized protein B0J15DRAFT_394509 [Fusarium solani]KAH7259990.1 hypothetical protein B0J15DRAFT_394509 [Fusarium solani]